VTKAKKLTLISTGITLGVAVLFLAFFIFYYFVSYPLKYKNYILVYSAEYNIKPPIVASVINAESSFNAAACSKSGAMGLMQILPGTGEYIAARLSVENFDDSMLLNAETNIEFGCFYLRYLMDKFTDVKTAFAAYNAGEGVVKQWLNNTDLSPDGVSLNNIPFEETKNFVDRVTRGIEVYKNRF